MPAQLIIRDDNRKTIKNREEIEFSSFSAFHLVVVAARAKSKKQISQKETDDEDLYIKIDEKTFPKLTDPARLIDSPAAFSGGTLHNLSKTVYFLVFLKGKDHRITLETDKPHKSATLENFKVYTVNLNKELTIEVENQAEDGDRRPWITFVLDSLPLKSITPTITYSRRKRDSDDVKIIVDGRTQGNILRTIKHLFWRYVGSRLPWSSPSKTETETFTVNLSQGLHYLEFWADRMPILHKITIDFGIKPSVPEGIPTVDNPKWTGDFYDDTEDILLARLIFGEAENQPKEAKIGVGFTVINRVNKQRPNWGLTIREVILKENQYDSLWSEATYEKVRDPLKSASEARKKAWVESYEVALGILSGAVSDTTNGATNFHSFTKPEDFPSWATEENFKVKIGDFYFYELEG